MKFRRNLLTILLPIGMLIASCGGETPQEGENLDVNSILTAGVGTLAASIFQTQTALVPPATQTSIPSAIPTGTPITLPSPASVPTQVFIFNTAIATTSLSPTPTGTRNTPTVNPSTLGFGCNNLLLLRDESIPAGTVMKPGESFTKIWKVENNGTCNWVFQYRLVFLSGERMDGEPAGLGKVIEPAKWTQLSIGLTAPKNPGTFTSTWRFGDQAGNMFGSTLSVSIVVAPPTNTPAPPTLTLTPSETPTSTTTPTSTETPTPTP
jgi:hypothetical protein